MSDARPEGAIAKHASSCWRWLWLIVKTVLIVLLLLVVLAGAAELLEPPFRLLFGWLFHLRSVLPAISWSMETLLCSLGALLLGVAGLHLLMPRLTGRGWPFRWSLAWCGLLTLLFATSIAAVGIVHQTGWLFRAPWFEDRTRSYIHGSISNAKQVILVCKQHASQNNGMWPDSLETLTSSDLLHTEKLFFSQVNRQVPPAPWIYLGAGLKDADDDATPVLISQQTAPDGPMVVGFLDGSAKYLAKPEEIQKIIEHLQQAAPR